MRIALLLIAHGSRSARANADLDHLAQALRERMHYPIVQTAYLELAEPTIEQGGQRCIDLGAEQVILLPYFLSAGVHVERDLAQAREGFARRFPHVDFRLAEPLGRHPLLVEIVAERAAAAELVQTKTAPTFADSPAKVKAEE